MYLKRGAEPYTEWSGRMPVNGHTYIRWWCHSTTGKAWNAIGDHQGLVEELRTDAVGCTSDGCHGPAHPFSKVGKREATR